MTDPKHILITGASSGIGAALAKAYAANNTTLSLTGRNKRRLENTAIACRDLGAHVLTRSIDVSHRAAMALWIKEVDAAVPLDLVIANAGISGGPGGISFETEEQARTIFSTNFSGVLNTLWPAIASMRTRNKGHIAIVSSLAGLRGMSTAPAYSASKAAILAYGDALRGALTRDGIAVSIICPGFVASGITKANQFPMPFIISSETAASLIKTGLSKRKPRIVFPWPTYLFMKVLALMPTMLGDKIVALLPKKT
ncbi:MAG: short-chain dehydrogenase [Rhodospirillaceae bacterium TMED8]|nr:short-chain dehydrogenase [Magnetovibrio sp.]OUT50840.1 MAG: short-chain dehydrogenase [Rhodospirillaceae bacterium TMED8]|tara:strand:- start:3716 stop:4480 length:765 start_codon:yes stop_codon:yes gene_type:complete